MKFKNLLITCILSIAFISCTFTEEIYLNNDGSGSYTFKMDMGEMMESMKGMSSRDTVNELKVIDTTMYFKDIIAEMKDSISKLSSDERDVINALKDFKLRMLVDEEKGKMLMNIGVDFTHISNLKNMEAKISKAQSLSDKKKSSSPPMPSNSDTEYSFDGKTFKRIVTLKDLSDEEGEQFKKSMSQSSSFLDGSNYKIIYHFENEIKKVSSELIKISDDRKTMILQMPMDTIIKNPKLLDFEVILRK